MNLALKRTISIAVVVIALAALFLCAFGMSIGYTAATKGNYELAIAFWRPLAVAGNADAQFNMGLSHARGRGVPVDLNRGVYWYRKAAENGSAAAQYNLADYLRLGEGVAQDKTQALVWMRKAADQNYRTAQNNLGMMYAEGSGTKKDLVKAATWFRIAISNDSKSAQENLVSFEKQMTPEQIDEARKAASLWKR
jgi:TPR repeat protein